MANSTSKHELFLETGRAMARNLFIQNQKRPDLFPVSSSDLKAIPITPVGFYELTVLESLQFILRGGIG